MTARLRSFALFRAALLGTLGGLLALAAVGVFRAKRWPPAGSFTPAAYLVAVDDSSRAQIGWHTRRVATSEALPPERDITVPEGSQVDLWFTEGRLERVAGPRVVRLPVPKREEPGELHARLGDLLEKTAEVESPPAEVVVVTSPSGVTRFLNPQISWIAKPNVLYDVAVGDPGDPLAPVRVVLGMKPPVMLSDLATTQKRELLPDRIYEVSVRESAKPTVIGGARFLTLSEASARDTLPATPAAALLDAAQAMHKKPTRTGDAWLALAKLPPAWRESELALRLRLLVALELGATEEVKAVNQSLRTLLK